MIVDELTSRPGARWLREWCSRAQIIQVPFRVYPGDPGLFHWDSMNDIMHLLPRMPGVPEVLGASTHEHAHPVFERLVLVGSETQDKGMLLVHAVPIGEAHRLGPYGDSTRLTDHDTLESVWNRWANIHPLDLEHYGHSLKYIARVRAVGLLGNQGSCLSFTVAWGGSHEVLLGAGYQYIHDYGIATRTDPVATARRTLYTPAELRHAAEIAADTKTVWALIRLLSFADAWESDNCFGIRKYVRYHDEVMKDMVRDSTPQSIADWWSACMGNWITLTLGSVSLMNCRNIVMEAAGPRHDRAARRRGDPAPYSYKVLKVKVPGPRKDGAAADIPLHAQAIHWVRGHFKEYTEQKPLFGRLIGLYWWQPHLAGRAEGFADKEYAIQ